MMEAKIGKIGAECACEELCPECKKYLDKQVESILMSIYQCSDGNKIHLSYLADVLIDELVLLV